MKGQRLILELIAVAVLVGVQPALWRWVENSAQDLHDLRTAAEQVANVQQEIQKLEQEKLAGANMDDQLDAVLITGSEISQAVERLEQTAQNMGLTLAASQIVTAEGDDGAVTTPLMITATATGPVATLLEYLEAIEHLTEITTVRSFTLLPAAQTIGQPTVNNFSLSFNIAFATEREARTETEEGKKAQPRFTSQETPPSPPSSFTSTAGRWLLIASIALLVGGVIVKIRRKRK